ncbi:hypothetical protein CYMTET_29972, partial [Cymbomonas tetramitiformis]
LVGKGAEVDAEDGEGRSALTVALAFGQDAAARALLEAGAGVNVGTGRRPLHVAAEKGMEEVVRVLVGKGAEVDAEDGEGCTALTVALAFGLEGAARALLEAGAGVKAGAGGTGGGKRSGVVVDRTSMSEIVGNVGMRQGMDVMTGRREAVDSMGTKRESMGTKRFGCAAVVHGHHIYAIGGHDESTQLQTVERMDVRTGQWKAGNGRSIRLWRWAWSKW